MTEAMMNTAQGLPGAAESNTEESREKANCTRSEIPFCEFCAFLRLFRWPTERGFAQGQNDARWALVWAGTTGTNWRGYDQSWSKSVKVSQTDMHRRKLSQLPINYAQITYHQLLTEQTMIPAATSGIAGDLGVATLERRKVRLFRQSEDRSSRALWPPGQSAVGQPKNQRLCQSISQATPELVIYER